MQSIKLSCSVMVLIFITGVLSNQCPSERNSNILKTIVMDNIDFGGYTVSEIEYDSETDQYLYMSKSRFTRYSNVLFRMDSIGNLIWSKAYNFSTSITNYTQFRTHINTLQYSSRSQALYYVQSAGNNVIVKVSSINGAFIKTYDTTILSDSEFIHSQCRLSDDEQAYFCNLRYRGSGSTNGRYIVRFDITNEQLDIVFITNTYQYWSVSILPISNREIIYSYCLKTNPYYSHHIVKANYIESSGSYSLNEIYHQFINKQGSRYSALCLGQNNDTVWHSTDYFGNVVFFELNLTNFFLIKTEKLIQFQYKNYFKLQMDAGEGIACILLTSSHNLLLVVNATTHELIQVYGGFANKAFIDIMLKNGYFQILGCDYLNSDLCYHKHIKVSIGPEDFPTLTKNASFSFSVSNAADEYKLADTTLANLSMSRIEDTGTNSIIASSYDLQSYSNQSYIIPIRDDLNHSLTVSPGQVVNLDLPCKADNFTSPFTACEFNSNMVPSWVDIDCTNLKIEIRQPDQNGNVSSSFSIKTTYPEGEFESYFNITFVPCNHKNCESCTNGTCDRYFPCPKRYGWNNETLSCDYQGPNYSAYGPTYDSTGSTLTLQIVVGLSIGFGILNTLLDGTYGQDVWSVVNFMHLVCVLPLMPKSMSNGVKNFIISNAVLTLFIYFVPPEIMKSTPAFKDLSFDQPDDYLRRLGLQSGSTLVNNFIFFMIFLTLAIFHLLFCLWFKLSKSEETRCDSIVEKAYKFLTFTPYIRILIEIYLFTTLILTSEVRYYVHNGGNDRFGHHQGDESRDIKGNYASLTITIILLILQLLFISLAFASWYRTKDTAKIDETIKTREFYSSILKMSGDCVGEIEKSKDDQSQGSQNLPLVPIKIKVARLYYVIFLARRLIMGLILVLIPSSLVSGLKISLLLVLQTLCIMYAILIRSFDSKKDQIVEAFNEIGILVLIIFLSSFYSKDDWTEAGESTFIGIILFQSFTFLLVNVTGTIFLFYKFAKAPNGKTKIINHATDLNKDTVSEENKFEIPSPRDEPFSEDNLRCHRINPNIFDQMRKTNYGDIREESKQFPGLQTTKIF